MDQQPDAACPSDHLVYAKIQAASVVAAAVFDELSIEPLFGDPESVLSVRGNVPTETGDLELTVWRPLGGDHRMCLHIGHHTDHGRDVPEVLHRLTAEPPHYGLDLGESDTDDAVLRGLVPLNLLFALAEPTHLGLTGDDRTNNLARLGEAVRDGFGSGLEAGAAELGEERAAGIQRLQLIAGTSYLSDIAFAVDDPDIPTELATVGILDTEESEEIVLRIWVDGQESEAWCEIDGAACQYDPTREEPDPSWHPDEGIRRLLADALVDLYLVHVQALELYESEVGTAKETIAASLTGYAAAAVADPDDEEDLDFDDEDFEDWRDAAEAFSGHCRLGLFGGVALQEGPYRELNIAGTAMDPVTGENVELKVYWHRDDPDAEPEHWLAVGQGFGPAHDVDPAYPHLLAAYPEGSHGHLVHAIGHLHQMVHLASDVVLGKTEEAMAFIEDVADGSKTAQLAAQSMESQAVADAIEGLNGIARLYTGSFPDRVPFLD